MIHYENETIVRAKPGFEIRAALKLAKAGEVEDRQGLMAALKAGDVVWTCIDPYAQDVHDRRVLMWDRSPEQLAERADLNGDDI